MINFNSINEVNNSVFASSFIKPLYNSYCFSNIPGTIMNMLTGSNRQALPSDVLGNLPQNYEKVVVFLVDAFGWSFFEKYHDRYPFLKEIVKNGVASKLTSQFPSTTASHITTLHAGSPVNVNGVFEWFYYEPLVDDVIAPLLFSRARDMEMETYKKAGVDPKTIFPGNTFYNDLADYGIKSYTVHTCGINDCTFYNTLLKGSKTIDYFTISEGLVNLGELMSSTEEKSYFYFYSSGVDMMSHRYGPGSMQFEAELDSYFTSLEHAFVNNFKSKLKNTLLVITADHGQMSVDPNGTCYLDTRLAKVGDYIKTTKKGELIVPCGSCRDLFLHIKDGYIDEAFDYLRTNLEDTAEVYKTRDLINDGLFGTGQPSDVFIKRVGDIVILPRGNNTVWWYDKGSFEIHYNGMHGGLSKEEIEIPFLVYPFI